MLGRCKSPEIPFQQKCRALLTQEARLPLADALLLFFKQFRNTRLAERGATLLNSLDRSLLNKIHKKLY